MGTVRRHLSYANVVATLALVLSVGGGVAVAADTVFSEDIVDGEVKVADIANNAVRTTHIGTGQVLSADLATDAVGSAEIAPDAIHPSDLAHDSVGTEELQHDAVGALKIADDAVHAPDLADHSVDSEHLRTNSVAKSEISVGAVGGSELLNVHEHRSSGFTVFDPLPQDGIMGHNTGEVSCGTGEQLLSASIDWTDTNGNDEAFLKEVEIDRTGTQDTAQVTGVFDGGGDHSNLGEFDAIATCIDN